MIRKLTLGIGFAAGYVLGARAGKERYAQIERQARQLMGKPAVRDLTDRASSTAEVAADKAKAAAADAKASVNQTVSAVADKVDEASEKARDAAGSGGTTTWPSGGTTAGAPGSTPTGTTSGTPTGPIVGAAPSATAPNP